MEVLNGFHHTVCDSLLQRYLGIMAENAGDSLLLRRLGDLALVAAPLPCRQTCLEHLIDLLQSPVLDFWKAEEDERSCDHAGWEPDVPILRAPVEGAWVDEVWSGEGRKPGAEEAYGGRQAKCV